MSQSDSFTYQEQLQCSICLDIFTNPASTPCGHSFCMTCIGRYWDNSRVCKCPLCKETFTKRPCLHINCTLKEITKQFKDQIETADRQPTLEKAHRLSLRKFTPNGRAGSSKEMDHEAHNITFSSREWLIIEPQLGTSQAEIQGMIHDRVIKVEELRASLDGMSASTERELQSSMQVLKVLVDSVESAQAKLLEVIQMNRLAAKQQAEELIEDLEREISQLRKRNSMITQLLKAKDNTLMLKHYITLCTPSRTKDWSGVSVNSGHCVEGIHRTVSQMAERFQEELQRLPEMSIRFPVEASPMRVQPKEIKIQDYAVDVTFDSTTAHPKLVLTEDRKQVWCGYKTKAVPDSPNRFDRLICVLGQEGFTGGRHYWEVGVAGKTDWDIGVARHSTHRKGKLTVNPTHGYWFLSLRDKSNFNIQTSSINRNQAPHIIGVFLDYNRGQVSFYNVDTKEHIHTFTDTFSKTIYPFFSPGGNNSGQNDAPLVITPVH